MEFDKILPDSVAELEPKGQIFVRRELVLGYDLKSGAPIKKIMAMGSFSSVKSALEYITTSSDCRHAVIIPLPGVSLSGFITKDQENGKEYLSLSSDKRAGISPGFIGGLYAAVTDNIMTLDIGISQDPNLFENGLSLIELDKEGSVSLEFIVNPGDHTLNDLADGVTLMLKKTNFIINKLLEGI